MPYTTELPQDDQARLVPAVDDREEVPDFDITPAAASKSAELTVDSKIDLAVMPRLFGTLQTIGGIGEMTAASLYISGSGGVGAVLGGGLMLAHGADGAATGIKQLWTGKQQETVTQQMLEPVVGKNIAAISDLALSFCSGGAHIVITSQRNLLMFGKPTTPYLFRVVKELKDKVDDLHFSPEQMPRVSLDQVRAMKGKHKLMYVVTKDGELLMTTNRFAKPMVTASGMKVSYVAHPAIAGTSVPVASAGQIFVRHGKIVKIDNCSGHFRPYGDELKKITEHVFERHGFQEAVGKFTYFGLEKGLKFGNWGNKPIATYDWVWPVLIPSGKLAANLESMGQSLGDSFIPAAHASAAMPEGSLPLGFSAQEFTQARNLFKDSGLLNQATPQVLTAALFMQQDPDDLFDLGANARSITEPHLHRTLREALSVTTPDAKQRSATLQQLVGSGLLGDPEEVSSYYLADSFGGWFADDPDAAKKQAAEKALDDMQQALDRGGAIPQATIDAFAKLMFDDVVPTLTTQALETLIASYDTNIDITGFENEETVTKPYRELRILTTQDAAPHERIAKTKEVRDNIFRIKLERQDFDNKLRYAGYAVEAVSLLARITHNKDLAKAASVLASGLKIGQNVAALAKHGTLAATAAAGGPIGIVFAIGLSILDIVDVLSSDGKDSSVVIMEALQQLSEKIHQLRTEMHARFDAVMQGIDTIYRQMFDFHYALQGSLDDIADRLKYMQETGFRYHKRELSYLETIVANLESLAHETKRTHKVDKLKALIEEIVLIKKEYASDPAKYSALRAALSMPLTERNFGIRDAELTGANSPAFENPAALSAHIDGFFPEFHFGTMAKLYAQLGLKSANYSPEIVNYYLTQILKESSEFQLAPCLTIADLTLRRLKEQKALFGLAKITKSFLSAEDTETSATILVIPLRVRAQWQLIIIDKLSKQVDIFAPATQPELMQKMEAIIKQVVPEDFPCRYKNFNSHVSPVYYGVLIVEIVKHLSNGESYIAVLRERSVEKLLLLAQTQEKLFKPSQQLLDTQQAVLGDVINPVIGRVLVGHLLELYYHKYPEVLDANLLDLAVDAVEINDIRDLLLALENPYLLHQGFCDEKLIRALFKSYQDAARELQASLVTAREGHEAHLSDDLNIAAKKVLTQQFTDEEAVRKFKLDIPVRVYGNWFTEVGDADCPRSPFIYVVCNQIRDSVLASMRYAREQLINHQAKQIKQVQDSFPVTAKEKIYKFKFERRIDLYNPRNFTADLMPSFIFPEQDGNPVLPNLVFGYDSVPIEMLTAQALEIGYIELRYNIDAIANTFNVKICLVANGNSAESCINSYSIKYKNEDSSINFYEGPEAVWWFWVGGECVQQKIVPSPQPRPATNVDEILRQGIRFSLDGGFHDYVNPPLTTRTGVGNLPLSSFTKLTNHTDPSSQLLLQEISKRIASKYQEMRKALNQDLRNELDNPASFLGQALVKFEQAYKVLRLFLEFIFADAHGNPSKALEAILYNVRVIFNKEKLLAFLGGPTEEYVATKVISDVTLSVAQAVCLSKLPVQAQIGPQYLSDLERDLAQAYDDFTPYQVVGKPSSYKQSGWQKKKVDYLALKTIFLQDALLRSVYLNPEEQERARGQLPQILAYMKNIDEAVEDIEKSFNSGALTLEEASARLDSMLGGRLLTSGPSVLTLPASPTPATSGVKQPKQTPLEYAPEKIVEEKPTPQQTRQTTTTIADVVIEERVGHGDGEDYEEEIYVRTVYDLPRPKQTVAASPDCTPAFIDGSPALVCTGDHYQTVVFPKGSGEVAVAPYGETGRTHYTGDFYDRSTCRPVTFYGKPSVYCEGESTTLFYTPDIEPGPFENLGGNIALAAVCIKLVSDATGWFWGKMFGNKEAREAPVIEELLPQDEFQQKAKELDCYLNSLAEQLDDYGTRGVSTKKDIAWSREILADRREELQDAIAAGGMTKSELHDFELDVLALANDMAATCIQHHLLRSFTPGSAGSCRLAEYRGAFFALQPPICVPPTRATSSTFPEVGAGANALPLNLQGRVG